ncbi:hypothetical protein EV421DRAFT_1835208, partial [Armillaria borealis]
IFDMVVLVYGLVHTASAVHHLASQSDPLNPDPTYPTLVVVFQKGTAKGAQLPDIAYFMIRSPAGKVYRTRHVCSKVVGWIQYFYMFICRYRRGSRRKVPFDLDAVEEMRVDGQYFFSHIPRRCACICKHSTSSWRCRTLSTSTTTVGSRFLSYDAIDE